LKQPFGKLSTDYYAQFGGGKGPCKVPYRRYRQPFPHTNTTRLFSIRIGVQVLYSGVLWPHPEWVTRLHHRSGANEAEISFQMSALAGLWTPDLVVYNGPERHHHRLRRIPSPGCSTVLESMAYLKLYVKYLSCIYFKEGTTGTLLSD